MSHQPATLAPIDLSLRPGAAKALSQLLDRRLAAYSVAAGTAGVAIAALAQDVSHQSILYTPANITIYSGKLTFAIDLNHDGIADFSFYGGHSGYSLGTAHISYYQGVVGWAGGSALNHPLTKGMEIGPDGEFVARQMMVRNVVSFGRRKHQLYPQSRCVGPFRNVNNSYLGIAFRINGEIHYGWIRISSLPCLGDGDVQGTVTGYAYNTAPNAPIQSGQIRSEDDAASRAVVPGSLGMLSLGAAGRK